MPATKVDRLTTFEVSKAGLAKLLERRGKEWVIAELVQNALDEATTSIRVELTAPEGGLSDVAVEDDNPSGFADLSHAYVLFAESAKKGDVTKRGRFNMGEKLAVALCREARISTTTGTVVFRDDGREMLNERRPAGSKFEGIVPMTDEEYERTCAFVRTIIVPKGVKLTFNGEAMTDRQPAATFEAKLRTEYADADGVLRPTTRKTPVRLYEPLPGETAHLYEMGLPVVPTGDRFHVDVGQKVPLGMDRDNVPPAYLRDVRTYVLNAAVELMTDEDASEKWVDDALAHKNVAPEAVRAIVKGRYGDKVVAADPSDREAEKIAVSKGYTVVKGGAFGKQAWNAVKDAEAIKPAGVVTPSPNPNEGADGLKILPMEHATDGVRYLCEFTAALGERVLGDHGVNVEVRLVNDVKWPFLATYGPRQHGAQGLFTFNVGKLGYAWFPDRDAAPTRANLELIIHEFAHHVAPQHLSREFYDACCEVGARIAVLLAGDQEFAAEWGLA